MNVLVLGSGGREHALSWKIAQDDTCDAIYIAPGNAGTSQVGTNVQINPENFDEVANFVIEKEIHMVVVGPEAPLVAGISDYFKQRTDLKNLMLIGPSRAGAELEGSKDFAKAFMARHDIPTAAYRTFTKDQVEEAKTYLTTIPAPYVLKADGLAAGKGVLILNSLKEAQKEIEEMLGNSKFGAASDRVVIEAFLDGIEMSVFALTDGKDYVLLPSAKDYKRIGEGDTGLNTGGMGAVSPVPFADASFMQKVEERIVKPTIDGLHKEGIEYLGFVFIGLIKVGDDPFVIEYNVRMGDPETEVVMPRIEKDFLKVLTAAATGKLANTKLPILSDFATTVMLVSGGYPEAYEKGKEISGLENVKEALVFHAGTKATETGTLSSGGRVLCLTGMDKHLEGALKKSFDAAQKVSFSGSYYRRDIGKDLLN